MTSAPPIRRVNPALLDALTKDVMDHNFDLQRLMRTIANSRAYQTGFLTNEWNANDRDNFSHGYPRRLMAEELMDAVSAAAGVQAQFPEVPEDTTASQLVDPHVGKEGFLDVFGRPPRESACECERRTDFSLPQALNLVNGKTISDAVADPQRPCHEAGVERQRRQSASWKSSIWRHWAACPLRRRVNAA